MSENNARIDYEDIFKIANVGVYKTTPDGKIVYANKYLATMLGYESVEELMERNLENQEYFNSAHPRSEFKESIEKNGYYKGQSCWITRNGEKVYVMEFAIKTEDENGNVYYEGIVENITPLIEEYNKEKRLKEEWINLFNAVPDSVIILSKDQTILDANEATLKLLNMKKEEIVGKKCYKVFHNTDEPPEGCPFVEMIENKNYSGFSEMVMDTVGGKYLVTVGLYDMVDGKKRIIHFAKDVNQIYDMREKIIEYLKRYNKILILINSINRIFMKERDEKTLVNSVCRSIVDLEYLEGSFIVLLNQNGEITLKSACNCNEIPVEEFVNERNMEMRELNIKDKKLLIFPIEYEKNLFGYLGIVARDKLNEEEMNLFQTISYDLSYVITRIRLEKEKSKVYEELQKNMEDLTTLVDGIRNPLAVIMGIAEIELKGDIKEKIVEEIEKINKVTKRVDEIWKRSEHLREFLER